MPEFLKLPGFHSLLFFIFLALFNWPILSIPENKPGQTIFFYLFLAWGFLITSIFLICLSLNGSDSDPKDGPNKGG